MAKTSTLHQDKMRSCPDRRQFSNKLVLAEAIYAMRYSLAKILDEAKARGISDADFIELKNYWKFLGELYKKHT